MEDHKAPLEPGTFPWPPETGVWQTYDFHCHCGAIRYQASLSPPLFESESQGKGVYTAVMCDCSACQRNSVIAVHPKAKNVKFIQGVEHRANYLHASKKMPNWFCKLCGSTLGGDVTWLMENVLHDEPRYTLNLRMLKDFDVKRLSIKEVFGMKDVEPKYSVD